MSTLKALLMVNNILFKKIISTIIKTILCLVLLQVTKCFVPVQIFWVSPKIWLHLVPLQKLMCRHKKQFYWIQTIFFVWHKMFVTAKYVNQFLVWHKKIRPGQKILWPVKGQGSSLQILIWLQTDKFTFDQMQSYQTSVVERECVEGIINTDYVTKYTTLAFLRKIDDINMSDTRGGKYFLDPFCCF